MQATAAPGRKALATQANNIFPKYDWTDSSDDSMSRERTQVQQPLLDDAWKHLQVGSVSSCSLQAW
jgi:hypothetical protein